jgi:hypothetical protein
MKLELQSWHIPFLDKHEFNLELTAIGCLLTFATVFFFVVKPLEFQFN